MTSPALDAQPRVSPSFFTPIPQSADERPQLFVVVDTEEEFDWSAPFSRENVAVTAMDEVGRAQSVFNRYGITPTYVIDYPIATTASSAERLKEMGRRGECLIGAHLHPWVNPPHVEALGIPTSYACNLGIDVEREKLVQLKAAILDHVGVPVRMFKAGRYGFGRTTAEILEELGFDVDLSVNPHRDFQFEGGPSFEGFEPMPSFFGTKRRLLELPCTSSFTGFARGIGEPLHRAASAPWLVPFRAIGILSRSRMLERIMLSPEGASLDEMCALTDTLYRDGVRTFSLTFHSPSLKPGCAPYVRTVAERDAFVATIDRYCEYFLNTLGGVPSTPIALYDRLNKGAWS